MGPKTMTEGSDGARSSDLIETLLKDDAVIADLLTANDERERYVDGWLVPTVARRRVERDHLSRKLEALNSAQQRQREVAARLVGVEADLQSARAEVDALRRSLSWRITAPVRAVYGWFLMLRGRP
jgi:hypothetical protein